MRLRGSAGKGQGRLEVDPGYQGSCSLPKWLCPADKAMRAESQPTPGPLILVLSRVGINNPTFQMGK